MTKELEDLLIEFEAVEMLSNEIRYKKEFIGNDTYRLYIKKNEIELLEKYLTELKAIKEAKPSEALKCVNVLKEDGCITTLYQGKALETIRQYILKAQELKKVLEVIFEKPLSLLVLKLFERSGIFDLEYEFFVEGYKAAIEDINEDVKEQIVTEEEFDLLKRH